MSNLDMEKHLQEILERIDQELTHIHYRWALYRQMFATNSYRIELMNKTSSNVFFEFQWLVIDYMVMALSKLTDGAKTGSNKNLSFHSLIEKIRKLDVKELTGELDHELEELAKACKKFRKIRDKYLAHNDLSAALEKDFPLPGVSRADIEIALKHTRNIMNKVELHLKDSQTDYENNILPLTNDGRSVFIWLQKGLTYEKLEDDGVIERGKWKELGNLDS